MEIEPKTVCPYYEKGKCYQPATCKWLHPADINVVQQQPPNHHQNHHQPELKLCPYFKEGRCNHGDACKWIHPMNMNSVVMKQNNQICPHFSVGKCFYGISCKFRHPSPSNNYISWSPQHPQGPVHTQMPPPMFDMSGMMPPMMNPMPPHQSPLSMSPSMLAHLQSQNLATPHSPLLSPSGLEMKNRERICRFWQEGHCPYDSCKFAHVGEAGTKPNPVQVEGKVCRYWQQGECHYANCIFPHVGPQDAALKKRPGDEQQEEEQLKQKRARVNGI
jgi:hypothetical protein